jgi:hypothetical protein
VIHGERVDRHSRVSTELALQSDRQLGALLDRSQALGTGIGGTAVLLDVSGIPVFAKRVPLTDLERRPGNAMSTTNLYGLPAYCQYGVGSPGFGAWRELAANTMTTNWVLARHTEAFPLLHHWRVLPGAAPLSEECADIDRAVAYWGGAQAMRQRINALAHASASIVLFLEFIPYNLTDWLAAQTTAGEESAAAACALLESQLLTAVALMNANGLTHFDGHFGNILTDGHRLYLTDLGLATSPRFDLSAQETLFLDHHRTHDLGYAVMRLANWLVTSVCGVGAPDEGGPLERNDYIRACADGVEPVGAPAGVAAAIRRHAPVAAIMNDFYRDLFTVSRAAPYPAEKIARALAAVPELDHDLSPPARAPARSTARRSIGAGRLRGR